MSPQHSTPAIFRFAVAAALALVACGDPSGQFVPLRGGPGSIMSATTGDAGIDAAGGRPDAGSPTDVRKTDGGGGRDAPATAGRDGGTGQGGASGMAGTTGTSEMSGTTGMSGVSGTGGPQEDACAACERAKCSKPRGMASNGDFYALEYAAYSVCFLGAGFPAKDVDPSVCPADTSQGPTAVSPPAAGSPKAKLCRDLIDCVHETKCDKDDQVQCYCGAGVSSAQCLNPQNKPSGACQKQVEAAAESIEVTGEGGVTNNWNNLCLAIGAAFEFLADCDVNCCSQECRGKPNEGDTGYC
ncbi:MAG TPA: hypothetical protein VHK47_05200, partial [Polyangia bacterium]|nr:hypothetical protein [Polyangia bacterium]